jgi:hypothetical protein
MSPAPAAPWATTFTAPSGQHDHFSANRLSDGIQLGLAYPVSEKPQITALDPHHGKSRATIPLAHMATLTHKNFSHCITPF